jgi:hypothetical protein
MSGNLVGNLVMSTTHVMSTTRYEHDAVMSTMRS